MNNSGTLKGSEVAELLFGQQHIGTQDYFKTKVGSSHTVPVSYSPHYLFACNDDKKAYMDYLSASWSFYNPQKTTADMKARQDKFTRHIEHVKTTGHIDTPISLYERLDGGLVVLDGNHRSAIALSLDINLAYKKVDHKTAMKSILAITGGRYGVDKDGVPYQGIVYGNKVILEGRRQDIVERFKMIRGKDLTGSVLDLGSNIGANCFLAAERGANRVLGIEYNPQVVSAAVRLNTFFKTPAMFKVHDLSVIYDEEQFDTVFAFSVYDHVENKKALAETIRRCTKKVLYFECHAGTDTKRYPEIFSMFSTPELVGYGAAGVHSKKWNRPIYRCEV
jgi:hypothetical protein